MTKEELAQKFSEIRALLDAGQEFNPEVPFDIYKAVGQLVFATETVDEITKPQRMLMKYRLLGHMYNFTDLLEQSFDDLALTAEQEALVLEIVTLAKQEETP